MIKVLMIKVLMIKVLMNDASHLSINTGRRRSHVLNAFKVLVLFFFFYKFPFHLPYFEHDLTFLANRTIPAISTITTMAPPLTGFFMKAVGLGEAHKQIEAEKRERTNAADRREFNRYRMQSMRPVHRYLFVAVWERKLI